jgi:NADH:ubiquinone oxidoreductase subunit H
MIAGHVDYSGTTFGMPHYSANHIGVTLFPTPSVLLYLPGVNDVTHKIKCFAGVVFEKVVELFSLAVLGTKVHI